MDARYRREDVEAEVRPVFDQLVAEFGPACEVWTRVENFGLWLSAGVVDPARRSHAEVEVRRGRSTRTALLGTREIGRIREHLSAGDDRPLRIGL